MEGGLMKKLIFLFFVIAISIYCSPKSEQVEKFMEDGVEVVINHLKPYKIEGEPAILNLKKEFSIDFARDDIGELGIADSTDFEVDSEGNIYFFYTNKEGDLIFKFDPHGDFVTSFGKKGQGPREMQWIIWTGIDSQDRLIVSDNGNRKILLFSHEGSLAKEIRYPTKTGLLYPLENGNFFGLWDKFPPPSDEFMYVWAFSLYNPEFDEIKILDTQNVYDFNTQGTRGIISRPFNTRQISKENIYVACEDRGYEILKYDLNGNLIQKIRKEYEPIAVCDQIIQEKKKLFEAFGEKIWFPKFWLPMGNFFLDDDGRIFVKTFEKGENPGEYIFDIFNPHGVFIGRKSMNILTLGDAYVCAKSRRERLYCFQEKPDGFHEFNVYRMNWD
jgi:hypothetical protein